MIVCENVFKRVLIFVYFIQSHTVVRNGRPRLRFNAFVIHYYGRPRRGDPTLSSVAVVRNVHHYFSIFVSQSIAFIFFIPLYVPVS